MEVGQAMGHQSWTFLFVEVGFKEESFRTLMKNIAKDKDVIKKLEKTRLEKKVDLAKA